MILEMMMLTGRLSISSSQYVAEPVNTSLIDGADDAQLGDFPSKFVNGQKTGHGTPSAIYGRRNRRSVERQRLCAVY